MLFNTHLSYKARNTLTLAVLLFLVTAIGVYFCFFYYARIEAKIDDQLTEKQKQIDALEFVAVQLVEREQKLQKELARLATIDKRIVAEVTPENSYQYFNTILSHSGKIDFNMSFTGSEKKKSFEQKSYIIKGEGHYGAIYRFISYLDKGPDLYKINRMSLRGGERINVETRKFETPVTFDMEILAPYANVKDLPKIDKSLRKVVFNKTRNVFYPFVKKEVLPNFDELLDIRQAELRAILSGKAYVVDPKGNTYTLSPGDKVYLGFLKKIDEAKNQAHFQLDKGGIAEEFVLKILFDGERQ